MNNEQLLVAVFGTDKPPISDIEVFTEQYPWCAVGHKLLFAALCARGNEAYVSHLPKPAVYLFDRSELLTMAKTSPLEPASEPILEPALELVSAPVPVSAIEPELAPVPEPVLVPDPTPAPEPILEPAPELVPTPVPVSAPAPIPEPADTFIELVPDSPPPSVVMKSGDYFSNEDFKAISLEDQNPIDRFIRLKPRMPKVQLQEERVSLLDVSDDDFMTETLAQIYVEQSLHQLARDAYKKLILLYPKKSDYFAALIQEIKLKTNR